ncbi:MAG: TetR family transcriptional regulator [Variibacter sp.]|nr:TetR family transcriptional regulator [Variibacter sp.]
MRRAALKERTATPGAHEDAEPSSRERLLDAAERLFADHGYDGVALRAIAEAARVNLGSIPYFFGTKENLFKAVLTRRVEPIQQERRDRLRALMQQPEEMSLESVLMAFLEPVFRESSEHEIFRRLAGRCATDPAPEVRRIMNSLYNADKILTPKALRMVCPGLSAEEFYWRLTCLYGAMFYIQADTGRMQAIAGRTFDMSRPDKAVTYLVPAFAAFFNAAPALPKTPA